MMKLSTKYILFVAVLHLAALGLTWVIFDQNRVFFIVAEVIIIISLIIAWQLYRQLIQPLKYLMQGVDAIKDRDFNVKFVSTGKHEVDQLIGVYNQMIDELRTERTRQEQQHFFLEKLIDTSPTGIVILNYDHRVEHINPRGLQIIGTEAKLLTGYLVDELSHPLFKLIKDLPLGQSVVVKPDGLNTYKLQKAHFIDRGFSRQFIMIADLTAEMLAVEKDVYGKVIRMMAHEVNNTIGPVNSIVQLALNTHQLWEGHQYNSLKDALQVAMDRNQNLNLFMRNFAELVKLPAPNKQLLDLHKLVHAVAELMQIKAAEKNIVFEFQLAPLPFTIKADEQLLEQVLINVVKNSLDAIALKGVIRFTTNAEHKTLTVTDNGHGINAADGQHLFTPFFSTKKDGQGIGLTLVREILQSHSFEFSLKTDAAGYTDFKIVF